MAGSERVLVCGAGPTGMVVAINLLRAGIGVRIVDAAPKPSPLSKAAVVWRRTLEVLHDAVPATRFIEHGRCMQGIQLEADGRILRKVEFASESTVFPPGVLIPQADTERLLAEALADLGAEIQRGVRIDSFEEIDDGVRVRLEDGEASEVEEFDWLIGADGAHSSVRHGLGIDFPGKALERRWLLADLDFEECGPEDRIRMFVGKGGMAGLFPYGDGRWRMIADGGPIDLGSPRRDPDLEEVDRELRRRTDIRWKIESAPWLAEFRVNERQVVSYRHGRVLLAGDAAHVHSPAGGQGMNTSIQDGVNLAWKLALVVQGRASETLMDTYDGERHAVAAAVLRGSGRMLQVAMNRSRPMSAMKRWLLPAILGVGWIQREAVRRLSEIDLSYHGGPLGVGRGDRWIGHRCPDVPIGSSGVSVYESLRSPGFTIFELGRPSEIEVDEREEVLSGTGFDLRRIRHIAGNGDIADEARAFASALGVSRGTMVVVRPDTYLGPVTSKPDRIRSWFENLRGH